MSAPVSDISDTMSLIAAWVAAEFEPKSGVEGTRPSGRTMVSTPLLPTQSTPIFVLRPNHSVDPEPKYAPADILTPDRPWPD
jgi:hypothetical protein